MKTCSKCGIGIGDRLAVPYKQSSMCIHCHRAEANEQSKWFYHKNKELKPARVVECQYCNKVFTVPAQNRANTCSVECRRKRKNLKEKIRRKR